MRYHNNPELLEGLQQSNSNHFQTYKYVTEKEEEEFRKLVSDATLSLDAFDCANPQKGVMKLMIDFRRNKLPNSIFMLPRPDARTVFALIDRLDLKKVAFQKKNQKRSENFKEFKNALSYAE